MELFKVVRNFIQVSGDRNYSSEEKITNTLVSPLKFTFLKIRLNMKIIQLHKLPTFFTSHPFSVQRAQWEAPSRKHVGPLCSLIGPRITAWTPTRCGQ